MKRALVAATVVVLIAAFWLASSLMSKSASQEPAGGTSGVVGLYVGSIENHNWWAPVLPKLRPLGIGHIRVMAFWSDIERRPGIFDWQNTDASVAAARRNGLGIELVISRTPAWTQRSSPTDARGPDNLARLAEFARALATRYAGRLLDLQVWNEPNNLPAYFVPYPGQTRPQSYVRLLRAVHDGIVASGRQVTVVAGNTDGRYQTSGDHWSPADFTAACYAAAKAQGWDLSSAFDIWAAHNYSGYPATRIPEFVFGPRGASPQTTLDAIRAILDAHGGAGKGLGVTEVGWLKGGSHMDFSNSPTRSTQRRYTIRNIVLALARQVRVYDIMFVFDVPENQKGLFVHNPPAYSPRPVASAVGELLHLLAGTSYQGAVSLGKGNFGYRFGAAGGRTVVVAWTTAGEYVTVADALGAATTAIQVPGVAGYRVIDLAGVTLASGSGPTVPLKLGNDPVFVVGTAP